MQDISNRQIFIETLVSVLMWIAIAVPLAVLLWWVSGFLPIPDRFRPSLGALAGVGAFLVLKFINRRRSVQNC